MRIARFLLFCLTSTLSFAATARAAQYPPGPGGAFPDTLTIAHLQDASVTPFPALLDTIYGLRGIITGFDTKPASYTLYMQDASGAPFTGLSVLTGSFNKNAAPMNLALGDMVSVSGRKQEFQGETEIEGVDELGTDDLVIVKLSSGNSLPPYYLGTTTSLREPPTNTNAERYEGMLTRLVSTPGSNQLKVARTVGLGINAFLVVSNAAPLDSVFIDGNALATYAPPVVGTNIEQVQGIVSERTRGYRILLRDGNDIVLASPPNLNDAYPITDTQIRVVFDRDVTTASATHLSNYSLASLGAVHAAVMENANTVLLTITNGLPHGTLESLTVGGITGLASGFTMPTPQSLTFVNGVLSCAEVEAPNPDSIAAAFPRCVDKSRFAGTGGQFAAGIPGPRLSFTGTAVAQYQALYFLNDVDQGLRGGVAVFAPTSPLTLGRRYRIVGQTQEFFGETQFTNTVDVADLGAGTLPDGRPVTVASAARDTCDGTQALLDGEDYEGMLVKLSYVKVVQKQTPLPTNGFHVAGPDPSYGDTIFVSNLNLALSPFVHPPLGSVLSVTGALHYVNAGFRVCPRSYSDIVTHGTNVGVNAGSGGIRFAVLRSPSLQPGVVFRLPSAAVVDVAVFDVSGRQVASLAHGMFPAGTYTRSWDGRAAEGGPLGAGLYFYRLRVGGEIRSLRAIKLGF